jgi:hypothetical protein
VPHHGSKENWLIQPAPHSLHRFHNYIFNYGLGREHHPGPEVVADIQVKCPGALIHLNNEVNSFAYSFRYQNFIDETNKNRIVESLKPLVRKKRPDQLF